MNFSCPALLQFQVASPTYNAEMNKYKVKCGASLQSWEQSGWIKPQDPYGWFQWYCRFYQVGFDSLDSLSYKLYLYYLVGKAYKL